jgi:hypothetical protein
MIKSLIKLIKWFAVSILALATALFVLSLVLQDQVIPVFLKSINKRISTRIETNSYKLTLLRKFPRASVRLKNVLVYPSPAFDKTQFKNADTLLFAKSVSLEFSMLNLIRGHYNIESISITGGTIYLLSDSSGGVNYEITTTGDSGTEDNFEINLEKIAISGLYAKYTNTATRLNIDGFIRNGHFRSRISGDNIDFLCNSDLKIRQFDLYSTHINTDAALLVDLNLHKSDSGILFNEGSFKIEDFRFGLSGFISASNVLDLNVTGQNIDLAGIKKYLPEKISEKFSDYSLSGVLKTECTIRGLLDKKHNPSVDLSFSLEKGHVLYRKSNVSIRNLAFIGSYTNGVLKNPESGRLKIDNYSFNFGSEIFSGGLELANLIHPEIDLTFSGEVNGPEFLEFIKIPDIEAAEGSFRINLHLTGPVKTRGKYTLSDLRDLNPKANIQFTSFGINDKKNLYSFKDVTGNIMLAKNLWAEDLWFSYKGQQFRVEGEFADFPDWLSGKQVSLKANADVQAESLNLPLEDNNTSSDNQSKPGSFKLPDRIIAHITFKINNFSYKTFSAGNIEGIMNYKPGVLNFNSLHINALNGSTSGDCLIARSGNNSYVTHSNLSFNNIDVNRAFKSFNNFGQNFIVAENLGGLLSGSLTLLIPLDSMLNPQVKGITAEGRYSLVNGTLTNFEPVKALSKFIEISELENIKFSKLENDLFIKNSYLAVPLMDIRSSAADFTVSGQHTFDNTYDYHVKAYLSEILSNKAKNKRRLPSEFGAVEEDGLGRTSVYLRINGNGDDIKVAYDLKAVGNNIKQSLKNEKTNLRQILNEEYGWFKKDSTIPVKPSSRPRFRISFPETDTVDVQKDTIDI